MDRIGGIGGGSDDPGIILFQSLLCMMREKNLLTRADIEELCEKVQVRAAQADAHPLPCRAEQATTAATEMERITDFIGRRYGGKHRRA